MAACSSTSYDEQDTAKRASLLRCPNKQYTAPFWLKVKQLFIGKDLKKNVKVVDEKKKISKSSEKTNKPHSSTSIGKICGIIALVALFCFSSVVCFTMWFTDIYMKQILETMTIHNGSFMFESWRKPSLKPLICVYAFNYTNLDQFISMEVDKLQVIETGPYCYRETLEKVNVHFDDEKGTVTYGNKRSHKFEPSHSKGNPNDTLVLPNPALITAASKVSRWKLRLLGGIIVRTVQKITDSPEILRVRAHDFFFGYEDKLLEGALELQKMKQDIRFDKFGILAIRAAETDDTLTVRTGRDDLDHIDEVIAVNGNPNLTIWHGDECNRIDGSDGAFFPRKDLNRASKLYLFHQDICRRLPLVYDKDVDFQDGIMAMRFRMPPSVYDTDGSCFCKSNCPPKGTFDLSPCANEIPFIMSFPHFLHGDPSLTENISGLRPNTSLHEFYIDVQPSLGFTLGLVSRLQVNMRVPKVPGVFRAFKNVNIVPIVWLEVFADHIPPDLFRVIYHATFTIRHVELCLMWGTLFMTVSTALCILVSLWRIPGRLESGLIKDAQQEVKTTTASQSQTMQPPVYCENNPAVITISDTNV